MAEDKGIELPPDFRWKPVHGSHPGEDPPLAVLDHLVGKKFAGTGFNTIFRPNNALPTTTFPNPPNTAVLELNLTTEELWFSKRLGTVPNRGFGGQGDIFLNGIPYMQTVRAVTNPDTGRADGTPYDIHAETGFWMNVPASNVNPQVGNTLVRMASIPHGTTINAQGGPAEGSSRDGPPPINPREITPFKIVDGKVVPQDKKDSQTLDNKNTPRLPQDLHLFNEQGTITQKILDDPAVILRNHNDQLDITKTLTFDVTTKSGSPPFSGPNVSPKEGGGTANIAFLVGSQGPSPSVSAPNANAIEMDSTFWIETVKSTITIPSFTPGGKLPLHIQPKLYKPSKENPPPPLPTFAVTPPRPILEPVDVDVEYEQLQYAQIVYLNFGDTVWPHVSVATLVPAKPIKVDPSKVPVAK